ncbi:MAG: tetratricopeptide repeat protein, partial [Rhodothermales bacterium]|nr:tetratricopeptide repeat protein [Rhodothermales bacterium]
AREAREYLGVDHVLTGTLLSAPNGYSLKLRLIDTSSNSVIRERSRAFGEAELAAVDALLQETVSGLLGVTLEPADRPEFITLGTTVGEAADYYINASGYVHRYDTPTHVDAAIHLLQLAVQADAEFAQAHAALSNAYLEKYRTSNDTAFFFRAIDSGRRAVEIAPDLVDGRVAIGSAYLAQGRHREAQAEFERAIAIDPEFAHTYYRLADIFFRQLEVGAAEKSLETAIRIEPSNWLYFNSLGQLYHKTGKASEAAEMFSKVVELRPSNPWGYNNVGAAYHKAGDLASAEEWYMRVAEVNPRATRAVAQAYRNIGGIRYTLDDFVEAVNWYERSIAIDSTSLEGWDHLGNARHMIGDQVGARLAWNHVRRIAESNLAFNPQDGLSMEYLAEYHAKTGEFEIALEFVRKLEQLDLKQFTAPLTAATVYELTGDRERALEYVRIALQNGWSAASVEATIWLDDLRSDHRFQITRWSGRDSIDERNTRTSQR